MRLKSSCKKARIQTNTHPVSQNPAFREQWTTVKPDTRIFLRCHNVGRCSMMSQCPQSQNNGMGLPSLLSRGNTGRCCSLDLRTLLSCPPKTQKYSVKNGAKHIHTQTGSIQNGNSPIIFKYFIKIQYFEAFIACV